MIRHDASRFALSPQASSDAYFAAGTLYPQGHAAATAAAAPGQVPAVSWLLMTAALVVLAMELVERFGGGPRHHSLTERSRKALPITDTELRHMATLAIAGDSSTPKNG
jgi:hypothetical protein